jgi:hypothetical protein
MRRKSSFMISSLKIMNKYILELECFSTFRLASRYTGISAHLIGCSRICEPANSSPRTMYLGHLCMVLHVYRADKVPPSCKTSKRSFIRTGYPFLIFHLVFLPLACCIQPFDIPVNSGKSLSSAVGQNNNTVQ